ncbi:MAG: nicotinate (nicotinamide) nucleotide adenylyltransferase [Treponema sp.]|nr:nicotinate (nicotinamide) nucleotide adenylyltransferase [Treponema sp.]
MKLAILGGSFNPIHNGHLYLAESALVAFGFDRILLVPANISPFKQAPAASVAPGTDRLDMILASIAADPRIAVDDLELRRGGISYTIDTVKEIIDRYRPEGRPGLILGDDLAADFSKWKHAEKIARIADIIIARRVPGGPEFPFPHRVLNNEVIDLASAAIRERIASGGAWHYLVPQGARFIIEDRGLYGVPRSSGSGEASYNGLLARIEDEVRAVLPVKRFIHSRNTALLARDLAIHYGLDKNAAYLAGIVHDLAKDQVPGLTHGMAAAILLQERFGVHNRDVLEAVKAHTTGKPGMGDLAKAVFIADKIEVSRKNDQGRQFREMAGKNGKGEDAYGLAELFHAVLKNNIQWLKEKGIEAAEESLHLLKEKNEKIL